MATKFSSCKGSYVLNQFPSNVMFGMNGFHLSASGAIQGHHGPLVSISLWTSTKFVHVMRLGSKLASPRGHKLEYRNKENQLQNSSSLKLEGLEL